MSMIFYTVMYAPSLNKTFVPAFGLEVDGNQDDNAIKPYIVHELLKTSFRGKTIPEDNFTSKLSCELLFSMRNIRKVGVMVMPAFKNTSVGLTLKLSKETSESTAFDGVFHLLNKLKGMKGDSDYFIAAELVRNVDLLISALGYNKKELSKEVSSLKHMEGSHRPNRFTIESPPTPLVSGIVRIFPVIGKNLYYVEVPANTVRHFIYDRDEKTPPALYPCSSKIPYNVGNHFTIGNWVKFLSKDGISPYPVCESYVFSS